MKRIISVIIVLTMLLSSVPVCFADDYSDHFSLNHDPLARLETVIANDFGEETLEQLRQNTDYWGTVNSVFTKEAADPTQEQFMEFTSRHYGFWLDTSLTSACEFEIQVKEEALEKCLGKSQNETQRNINKYIGLNYPDKLVNNVYNGDDLDVYIRLSLTKQQNDLVTLSVFESTAFAWAYLHLTPLEKYYFIAKMCYYFEKDNEETPKVWVKITPIYRSGEQMNFSADINLDGDVSITDLKYLMAYMLGKRDIINFAAADRDGDGEITLKDYKKFKQYLMTN